MMDISTPGVGWDSRRLWSLWDMMNWSLDSFIWALRFVRQHIVIGMSAASEKVDAVLDGELREVTLENLKHVRKVCVEQMMMSGVDDRFARIYALFQAPQITHIALATELRTLLEVIEDDARKERFFHYPRAKASMLVLARAHWLAAFEKFPSVGKEAEAGIDSYALGHNAAAVFYMMRVAEIGMRALARERKVSFPKHPLEWAEWENIINEIEKNARAVTAGMSRGPAKDAAGAFYTAAVAQLRAFKETRNRVMHVRGNPDELDALKAINQVRDFMNGLSAKIGETTKRPIRKWP